MPSISSNAVAYAKRGSTDISMILLEIDLRDVREVQIEVLPGGPLAADEVDLVAEAAVVEKGLRALARLHLDGDGHDRPTVAARAGLGRHGRTDDLRDVVFRRKE